ncbi:MAG: hypothetical protein K2P84_01885 [Undibacterium sp.]|nr:hypothetical protein [Undibacterium sp.]
MAPTKIRTPIIFAALFSLVQVAAQAQSALTSPVTWSSQIVPEKEGRANVQISAKLQAGWHIFSLHQASGGPTATHIQFAPSKDYQLVGATLEPKSISYYEKLFKMEVRYFENEVVFQQKIRWTKQPQPLKANIEFMVCSPKECLPPDEIELLIAPKL